MKRGLKKLHKKLLSLAEHYPLFMISSLFVVFVVFLGLFNTTVEKTNTEEFCISCHEMYDNVYQEYKTSIHASNNSGVRASCPDCHVPKQWFDKLLRKVAASNELFHHFIGSIATKNKFSEKRLYLAEHVWTKMQQNDSHECRNCHDINTMNLSGQAVKPGVVHRYGLDNNKTCIDCHKGIAHQLPKGFVDKAFAATMDDMHKILEKQQFKCFLCHENMAHSDW